ncbi:RNA polymerase sigma factor [Streptomyces formicae]
MEILALTQDSNLPESRNIQELAGRSLDDRITELISSQVKALWLWAEVEEELARYGIAVLRAWVANGTLASRVASFTGRTFWLDTRVMSDGECLQEIIGLTVAASLNKFRTKALTGSGWAAGGGASARTYFAGQCLLMFPTEHRRMVREQYVDHVDFLAKIDSRQAGDGPDYEPEETALSHQVVNSLLNDLDSRTRAILRYRMNGYSLSGIAAEMGVTAKAVGMVLYRCRKRLRDSAPLVTKPL